jgi:predicted Zn-dependent protease
MFRMFRLSVLACAVTGVCGRAQAAAAPDGPSVADARALITQGKMSDALRELDALAAQHPEPAGVERLRGIVEYQDEHLQDAEASFAKAVAQDPSDLESMQMRGVVLYRLGKAAEAIPLLEKAHSAGPVANADPHYVLALCYITTGRYDDARRALATQYQFEPNSAAAWLVTARMLFRQELTAPAAAAAKQAVQLDAHLPLAHRLLGEIDLANGDTAGAIVELEKERAVNPLDGETYDRLGDAYIRSGQYAHAQEVLDRAVLLEPNATGPYILLGKALLAQQDPAMATMYLEHALAMDPSNSMTHMLLGRAFAAAGRKDEAEHEFAAVRRLQDTRTPAGRNP